LVYASDILDEANFIERIMEGSKIIQHNSSPWCWC